MKKSIFLFAILGMTLSLNAQNTSAPVVVLEEDFSLCTAGTPEKPDTKNIAPGTNYVYEVDAAYTHQPHWSGYYVFQAGGCVAVSQYDYYGYTYGGHISTPEAELYGVATISFRARRAGTTPNAGKLDLSLCDNTSGRLESVEFELTTEWQDFTWTSDKGTFNNKNIFQFSTVDGTILIDDIKITRLRNRTPGVVANLPKNNSATEFVANWQRSQVKEIDGYLFSVWCKEMPKEEISGKLSYDFESIKVKSDGQSIDTDNPGYPEGWTIDVSSQGSKDMCTTTGDYKSGKQAIHFDAEGDYILTPETPAPIHKISFWVKPSSMAEEEYNYSMVGVQVKNMDGKWEAIANLPNYWMEKKGGYLTFEGDELGHYVNQIKLECVGSYGITFAIDDITLEYQTQPMPKALITDTLLTDTFCVVSGIDPSMEHFYNVKVKEGDMISEPSEDVWVDGIRGVTPVALPATNVTENSFTANWEMNHNAGSYKLNILQTTTTKRDNEEVVILEEDFSGIKDGTFDNPGFSWDLVHSLSANGQSEHDWLLTYPRWVVGMAGSQGPNYYSGKAGLVVGPEMKFGNNAVKVSFKAYNKVPGDRLWVMIIKDHEAAQAEIGMPVAFSATASGYITDSVVLSGMDFGNTPLHVAFMSEQGEYYVDDIKISFIVPQAGTLVEIPYKTIDVTDTSYTFTDLPEGITDYAYNVMVKRTKDFYTYTSNYSNTIEVKLVSTDIEEITTQESNTHKLLHNGQILIHRDGKTYSVMGVEIK
jgi:hypothetical protein